MTIADAIKECQRKMEEQPETVWWFRPVCWRGCYLALEMRWDNRVWIVPQSDQSRKYIPRVSELLDEWEVVTSDVVLGER